MPRQRRSTQIRAAFEFQAPNKKAPPKGRADILFAPPGAFASAPAVLRNTTNSLFEGRYGRTPS